MYIHPKARLTCKCQEKNMTVVNKSCSLNLNEGPKVALLFLTLCKKYFFFNSRLHKIPELTDFALWHVPFWCAHDADQKQNWQFIMRSKVLLVEIKMYAQILTSCVGTVAKRANLRHFGRQFALEIQKSLWEKLFYLDRNICELWICFWSIFWTLWVIWYTYRRKMHTVQMWCGGAKKWPF